MVSGSVYVIKNGAVPKSRSSAAKEGLRMGADVCWGRNAGNGACHLGAGVRMFGFISSTPC